MEASGHQPASSSNHKQMEETAWGSLQISPKQILSMPYGNFRVAIYEKQESPGDKSHAMYYFCPIVVLDHGSAECKRNETTDQIEVRFNIEFWNPSLQNDIWQYLKERISPDIGDHQIAVIPFEKIMLTSSELSLKYCFPNNWVLYQSHQSCPFKLICSSIEMGEQLAHQMKKDPQQFGHLKLLFSVHSQTSRRKETVIRIEHILNGHLFSQLKKRFPNQDFILLRADDAKRLVSESTSNVIVDTFDDNEIVNDTCASPIYKMLEHLIITGIKSIKQMEKFSWDSVFWEPEDSRPDKVVKILSDILNERDSKIRDELKKTLSCSENSTGQGSVKIGSLMKVADAECSGNLTTDETKSEAKDKVVVNDLIEKNHTTIEWDGEKFIPKPMDLVRINLSQLHQSQTFQDKKVSVSYSVSLLSLGVNIDKEHGRDQMNTCVYFDVTGIVNESLYEKEYNKLHRRIEKGYEAVLGHAVPVPYKAFRLNRRNAMNLSNGEFTALVKGYYFFNFKASLPCSSHGLCIFSLVKKFLDDTHEVVKRCTVDFETGRRFVMLSTSYSSSMYSIVALEAGEKVFVVMELEHGYKTADKRSITDRTTLYHFPNKSTHRVFRSQSPKVLVTNFVGGKLWSNSVD